MGYVYWNFFMQIILDQESLVCQYQVFRLEKVLNGISLWVSFAWGVWCQCNLISSCSFGSAEMKKASWFYFSPGFRDSECYWHIPDSIYTAVEECSQAQVCIVMMKFQESHEHLVFKNEFYGVPTNIVMEPCGCPSSLSVISSVAPFSSLSMATGLVSFQSVWALGIL